MTVRGRETIDGADVYVVDTVPMFSRPDRLYFDVRSGLLVRMDRRGMYGELVNYLEDYRAIDGMKLAFPTRPASVAISPLVKRSQNLWHFSNSVQTELEKCQRFCDFFTSSATCIFSRA